jgi:hypothetical protein
MNGPTLDSWKEIAQFLERDVKTCQRWEKERGLPVHRFNGAKKSRVFANEEELIQWRQKNYSNNSLEEKSSLPSKKHKTKYLLFAMPLAAILLYVFVHYDLYSFIIPYATPHNSIIESNPADYHINGSTLIIINKNGKELWSFDTRIEKLIEEKEYKAQEMRARNESRAVFSYFIIKDINQDGRAEVLFSPKTTDQYGEWDLFCFDYKGKKLWEIKAGGKHIFGPSDYSSDYRVIGMTTVDFFGDGKLEIVVNAAHMDDFPSQLLVLSAEGRLIGEYWNAGRFTDVAFEDIDDDGTKDILAVGTNNEYEKACLIVLDPRNMHGFSPQLKAKYQCAEFPPGTEKFYILFPRTDVDKITSPPRDAMDRIIILQDHIIKATPQFSRIDYEFDYELGIVNIVRHYAFDFEYDKLRQEGRITGVLNDDYDERLKAGLQYWNGREWVAHRAASHE